MRLLIQDIRNKNNIMTHPSSKYGAIHRYEPARESMAAAIAIVLLTMFEILFSILFTYGLILGGWGFSGMGNMYLGGLLAAIFINLSFILALYRRDFLPDVVIVKQRRRKWEDIYTKQEDVHGQSIISTIMEKTKNALYLYNKK